MEYIYFAKNGVWRALEMIRDKEIRSANQRDKLIGASQQIYNDNPPTYETINDLREFFDSTELELGEDFTQLGISITNVKTAIRDEIWELLNELDSNRFSEEAVDAASGRAADILRSIETLNDGIRLVYQRLNTR